MVLTTTRRFCGDHELGDLLEQFVRLWEIFLRVMRGKQLGRRAAAN